MKIAMPEGHATSPNNWEEFCKQHANKERSELSGGNMTDLEVAFEIASLKRTDLNHEAVLTTAKDRIRWLSIQLAMMIEQAQAER